MTIFNVIKYPVSSPPTIAELEIIPKRVYRRWASKVNFGSRVPPEQIALWFLVESQKKERYMSEMAEVDLNLLRTMISRMRS